MADGFVCSYADILYRPHGRASSAGARGRYRALRWTRIGVRAMSDRSQHPEDDAEKNRGRGRPGSWRSTALFLRSTASGEYIGVGAVLVRRGARSLRDHYRRVKAKYARADLEVRDMPFEKAYLIHLFEEMIGRRIGLAHGGPLMASIWKLTRKRDVALANARWLGRIRRLAISSFTRQSADITQI